MVRNEIRYIDLFGGIGGFRLGIEQAQAKTSQCKSGQKGKLRPETLLGYNRFKCVAYYEIDKYAIHTYNKNFKENYAPTDITTVATTDIPDCDLICAGFPCQSFSIAGKRRGFFDTRGTLFFEIARIAKSKRPSYLFLENVKGLLNHNKGATFRKILQTLEELGYETQWMVLNSKFFGVPQNRERVFIIGNLRGKSRPEILPFRESSQGIIERDTETPSVRAFTAGGHSGGHHSGMTLILPMVANCVTPDAYLARGERKRVNGKAVLTSMCDRRIRRLTPTECERLQGFPDGWTEGVSDTQRYKQLGNAVTVNVIEAIMRCWFYGPAKNI